MVLGNVGTFSSRHAGRGPQEVEEAWNLAITGDGPAGSTDGRYSAIKTMPMVSSQRVKRRSESGVDAIAIATGVLILARLKKDIVE